MRVAAGITTAWNGGQDEAGEREGAVSLTTGKESDVLPGELFDMAIDFLHDDKDSLSYCSLVCRAWLPPSRYHLFRSITAWDSKRTFAQLQPFLAAISSSISAIRELNIYGQDALTIEGVQDALRSLPGLRVLKVVDCMIKPYRTDGRRPTPCIPHVSRLTLIHCNTTADDLDPLLDLIALFSHVDYLKLQNNNLKFLRNPRAFGSGLSSTSFRTISAVMTPLPMLARLILHSKAPAGIKRIELIACTVTVGSDDGAGPFGVLLDAIMPTLESFGVTPGRYLAFNECHVLAGTAESYAISRCARFGLRSLDILLPQFSDMQQLMKLILSFTYDFRMRELPQVVRAVRFVVSSIASVEDPAPPPRYTAQTFEEEIAFYWLYVDHNFESTEFSDRTFEMVMADDATPACRAKVPPLRTSLEKRLAAMVDRSQLTIFPDFSASG